MEGARVPISMQICGCAHPSTSSTAPWVSLLVTPGEPLKTTFPRATVLANKAPNNSSYSHLHHRLFFPSAGFGFYEGKTGADCQRVTSQETSFPPGWLGSGKSEPSRGLCSGRVWSPWEVGKVEHRA